MRQGQQNNKRMRGRGRNKSPNQANRVYESNGPDVKVRGSAAHVAEKYQTLARDAQSSGDTIASENYLQHAEHYLRIIAAAQAQNQALQQQPQQGGQDHGDMNGAEQQRANGAGDHGDSDDDDRPQAQAGDGNQPDNPGKGGGRRRRGSGDQNERAASANDDDEGGDQPAAPKSREKEDASDAAEPAA